MKLRKKAPILCVIGLIISLFGVSIGFEEPTSAIDCPAGQHSEIVARPNPNYPSTQISSEECIDDGETQITNQQNNGANETNQNNSDGTTENNNGGNSDDDDPAAKCYDSGLDSMGWVVCPAIENIKNTTDGMLGVIEGWVSIDTDIFSQESGTYKGWEVFRNIANIILVIIFLFIIFSQITGYGIDNYGIKKALPRLIALAIFINLSYIICVIAVDVSNVIGRGIANLLKQGVAYTIQDPGENEAASLGVAAFIDAIIGAAAGSGVLAGAAAATGLGVGGPGIIMVLLMCLVVALVAIFMFFIMISARMMAIVLLVVLAPVAFAMYILPNTQSLFNQWWKIFKTCLVVYPICGALYGTAFIIQGIASSDNGNLMWQMLAVIAPFIPFLALPSLLKNAMAALGSFGAALTMIGSGIRRGAQGAKTGYMNSKGFQELQQRTQRRQAENQANKTIQAMDRIRNRGGKLTDEQRERYRQAMDIKNAADSRKSENKTITDNAEAYMETAKNKQGLQNSAQLSYMNRMTNQENVDAYNAKQSAQDESELVESYQTNYGNGAYGVNITDLKTVRDEHKRALDAYQTAQASGDEEAKKNALARVKASQNILSTSKLGRGYVEDNVKTALATGENDAAQAAATHIMREHGDTYKTASRGVNQMMQDLSTATTQADFNNVSTNIANHTYDTYDAGAYDSQALINADARTLESFSNNLSTMNPTDRDNIQSTAYATLENAEQGNINLSADTETQLRNITSGYTPKLTPSRVEETGTYIDLHGGNGVKVAQQTKSGDIYIKGHNNPVSNPEHYAKVVNSGVYEDPRGNREMIYEIEGGKRVRGDGSEVHNFTDYNSV